MPGMMYVVSGVFILGRKPHEKKMKDKIENIWRI